MQKIWGSDQTQHFHSLSFDQVLDAVESFGFQTTGQVLSMGAMENRVFDVKIESDQYPSIIIKFYRPGRWSELQIQDEHDFLFDLIEQDIQAIAPLKNSIGQSVFTQNELFYALFPKKGGRAADEWNPELIEQMGRLIARVHNVGSIKPAQHRLKLDIETFGVANLEYLIENKVIPLELENQYRQICEVIFNEAGPLLRKAHYIRTHGDCHHGNVLINQSPFLIDFDDMLMAPSVQDIWMIAPGDDQYSLNLREKLLDGYFQMRDFDMSELKLIPYLRILRMVHFSSWIAHRYEDTSFKNAFQNFGSYDYFSREITLIQELQRSTKPFN